jgi:CO/xanthine dehydrogenase FAD-binding subunit
VDLGTVETLRVARSRADLLLAPGEAFLAGGSWLFSEPQPETTGLVDLSTMPWAPWTETRAGLAVAATCTLATLRAWGEAAGRSLFVQCVDALLMSFKVQNTATVGGNLALALPAGAMVSLAVALDAELVIWTAAGGERREPVASFVTGPGTTTLEAGEVIRSIDFPAAALRARTAFRKIALTPLGRSSSVVTGRYDDGRFTLAVTAATPRPEVLAFPGLPEPAELLASIDGIAEWYDDPHGAPDWRQAVTRRLAGEVLEELSR